MVPSPQAGLRLQREAMQGVGPDAKHCPAPTRTAESCDLPPRTPQVKRGLRSSLLGHTRVLRRDQG